MKNLLAVLLCLGLAGCASVSDYQRESSGRIGCAPNDIQVTEINHPLMGAATWTADCKGEKYYCTDSSTKYDTVINCAKSK